MTRGTRPHVIVVGAGPAGTSAATLLSRRGARVTMLDKARFPRDKVCGDGITPRGLGMFKLLKLVPPTERAQTIRRIHLVSPSDYVLSVAIPERHGREARAIKRVDLDQALVELAVASGAELREGFDVAGVECDASGASVRGGDGTVVRGDVVLGCDGSPSVVRQALGLPRFPPAHTSVAFRGYYENVRLTEPDAFGLYWQKDLLPGYGWVFPLPGGGANVGVGIRFDHSKRSGRKIQDLYDMFCRSEPVARQLVGATPLGRPRGHLLPLGSFRGRVHANRALLLGDAAGFINPVTGEGIEFALESGELACEVVSKAAEAGRFDAEALAPYDSLCTHRFGAAFALNYQLQRLFVSPVAVDLALRTAGTFPALSDTLLDIMAGDLPGALWRGLGGLLDRGARARARLPAATDRARA